MIRHSKCFKILNKVKNRKLRLFCFPYAGGNASIYFPFKDKLGEEIELVAIQLPGRSERMFEEAFTDMDTLVDTIYKQILPTLNGPFAFLGYSMGGVIAYALTKKIEAFSSYRPKFTIISATKPVALINQSSRHNLDDAALIDVLRAHKASPKEVLDSKELMEMILPTIRADYQLIETYRITADKVLETPLVIFNSEEDMEKETVLQWQKYFKHPAAYVKFGHGHFFIHKEVDKMAAEIKALIA